MKSIAITGKKGGTGKTALCHALALGAAWTGKHAHLCHTDDREPLKTLNRPYMYYDAREPKQLEMIADAAASQDGLLIIDLGGNRPQFDEWVAAFADLIIIPTAPDPEDVRESIEHAKRIKAAGGEVVKFVVNKYPASEKERKFVERYLDLLPQEDILCYVPEIKVIRTLREADVEAFKTPPTRLNNAARRFYREVNTLLCNLPIAD